MLFNLDQMTGFYLKSFWILFLSFLCSSLHDNPFKSAAVSFTIHCDLKFLSNHHACFLSLILLGAMDNENLRLTETSAGYIFIKTNNVGISQSSLCSTSDSTFFHRDSQDIHSIKTLTTPYHHRQMSKQYEKLNQEPRPSSLLTIKCELLPPKRKASTPKSTPRIFAANVRSITNTKHAQLVQLSVDYDIMLISESWLQPHKKQAYSIPNFQLHSVERTRRRAGGVCIFVRNSFAVTVVNEYTSENVSALWICMHNENEPATIYASIYHPPNLKRAVCDQTIDYMISTVSDLASNHPNAKFLIYGDFNDLDMTPFEDVVSLTQLVWFPNRGQNKLDLVYTDITEYSEDPHKTCQSAPNVGRNDHSSIEISTSFSPKPKYETIQRRVVSQTSCICKTGMQF